jgi:2-polyprenyl-6-methoxyphenol hydroxylase-like FAD-dependent oxidoreductase
MTAHSRHPHHAPGGSRDPGHDVIVVGGRVAGASTAMLLARAGLGVVLLDRGDYGTDSLSTHALMRAGVVQLSRWGVLPAVRAEGTPSVSKVVFHYAGDASVPVLLKPYAGVSALYAPRRHVLDRILVDAAADAGVDVRHGVGVTGLVRDDAGRVVGVRAEERGRSFNLRARWTVGADGIRSTVAREVGAPVLRQAAVRATVLYRYHGDLPTEGYEWSYGPGAGAGMIPTNDGETGVFVSTTPDRMRALRRGGVDDAFWRLLATAAPGQVARARRSTPASRMFGWSGVPGFVRRAHGPGWALVGDAGYFKDPVTAHGMTDALRDAELLAVALVEAVTGARDEAAALASYQRTRDAVSGRHFRATEEVARFSWDMDRIPALLREVSDAMSDEVELLASLPAATVAAASPDPRA